MKNSLSVKSRRWEAEKAWVWYRAEPWLRGCNFTPSSAVNQLEMWQADTFDADGIGRELGWLADLGMNSMRVFLHDLLWVQDRKGFLDRMERYLEISDARKIGTMFVFFDSCWSPDAKLGPQPAPRPGVHNSGWLRSPVPSVVLDPTQWGRLEDYVCAVLERFKNDARVHVWDLWNEPGNYGDREAVAALLARVFDWSWSVRPDQPFTSGVSLPAEFDRATWDGIPTVQLESSDVISFHSYGPLDEVKERVAKLKVLGRPLLCTEYMGRRSGSTFQGIMPYFHQEKIGAYNWGAVAGKTQTNWPWPWEKDLKPFEGEPVPWLHDIFRPNGEPYDRAETDLIRSFRDD